MDNLDVYLTHIYLIAVSERDRCFEALVTDMLCPDCAAEILNNDDDDDIRF
jgi:hypothetical protein